MKARTRSRIGEYLEGVEIKYGQRGYRKVLLSQEHCEDVIGNYMGNNPFWLDKLEREPNVMNGSIGDAWWNRISFQNYPVELQPFVVHVPFSDSQFRDPTNAIGSSHPGSSAVSVPNFLFELKDVPGMLQTAARRAIDLHKYWKVKGWTVSHSALASYYSRKRLGEDWLNYHFGWRPFFSDLKDIIMLDGFIQKRKKLYKSIRGSELRTMGTLGSATDSRTEEVPLNSLTVGLSATQQRTTTTRRWFAAQWSVDPIRFSVVLTGKQEEFLRDALGVGTDLPLQMWDAMPWTWLLDWFSNVDSLLSLAGNRQGVKFKDAVIMSETTTEIVLTPINPYTSWLSVSVGKHKRTTKQRWRFEPTFLRNDTGIEIFGPSQLATLASLSVTRGR